MVRAPFSFRTQAVACPAIAYTRQHRVSLRVSTSGTDADFIVKLIDVYPDNFARPESTAGNGPNDDQAGRPWNSPRSRDTELCGYQQLVRGEPFRGKYRESLEEPTPFVPGVVSTVSFSMPDICHCFRSGHQIMVHVQSSWFPLVSSSVRHTRLTQFLTLCGTQLRPLIFLVPQSSAQALCSANTKCCTRLRRTGRSQSADILQRIYM